MLAIDLWGKLGLVALGAHTVRELGVTSLFYIHLELLPSIVVLVDSLAVGTDGQQAFQLLHLGLEPKNAFCHPQASH
jgi:hypothetical protein